jgi:hypothetical protein
MNSATGVGNLNRTLLKRKKWEFLEVLDVVSERFGGSSWSLEGCPGGLRIKNLKIMH